jgi:4'-phosphopantetheinyl transferase EntD
LADLFQRPDVICQESSLGESGEALYPEENRLLSGYAERRRRDFVASRRCARKALRVLGITDFPLLYGQDRAPIWPTSVVGTITHTDGGANGYCAVAVADKRAILGLGIDAEPALPLTRDLWPHVLDDQEQRDALAVGDPGIHARLVFSAKETTYKALYPAFKRFLEFSDVHIQVLGQEGIFLADLVGEARGIRVPGGRIAGRLVVDDEFIVTAMVLPAQGLSLAQEGLSQQHVPC